MAERRHGNLRLPLHLKWSGPRDYDLSDLCQRRRVYEIVLREGRAEDLRQYVDLDELRRIRGDLFLPVNVRTAWEDYFVRASLQDRRTPCVREKPDTFYAALSPLQHRLALLFLGLPEAANFALAGGAALVFHRVIPRTTKDLDFFGTMAEEVRPAAESLLARLAEEGLPVEIVRSSPAFVRLAVRNATCEEVLVDIGRDGRLRKPDRTEIGRVLPMEELAADKLLALFDRAEARDFVDVYFLARRFGIGTMLDWAKEKATGFDPYRLALGLGRLELLPRDEFEVDDELFAEMVGFFRALRASLIEEAMSR